MSKPTYREPFRGMMPILPTAILPTGELDEASQRRLVHYALKCDAAAIGHFGFASEFHKVSDPQRRRLTELILEEAAGKVPVFIGVTAPGVRTAVEYAREAEAMGADLIMAALPYVNLPDTEGAYRYFAQLNEATSLPIIVQDIPEHSHILTPELIIRLHNDLPGIAHVKAEGANFLEKTQRLMDLSGGKLPVIGGAGGRRMIHLLRLGVTSFMTGTEALHLHGAVLKTFLEGDEEGAAAIYFERVLPYLAFYLDNPEELLKAMLHELGVMDHPDVLAPPVSPPLSATEWKEFNWVLDRIDWRRKWPDIP